MEALILFGESLESVVECDEPIVDIADHQVVVVEGHPDGAAGSLAGLTCTRLIDQQPAHHARSHREKMRAVLPVNLANVSQLQEGFVDERRRRNVVAGPFPPEVAPCHATKLVIDQRRKLVESTLVTSPPCDEQCRQVRCHGLS